MNFLELRNLCALLIGLAFLSMTACGGGGSGGSSGSGEGTLVTWLTDNATDTYQAVYVTIARVQVHMGGEGEEEGSWKTVAEPNGTYNLLELVNGVREQLGQTSLDSGSYTQMRLIIGETADSGLNIFSQPHPYANYVVYRADDRIRELKVPSGPQTGLKVVAGFEISADETTELILDFDAMRSVVKAGASGIYLLKPTIKVLDMVENAKVLGVVTDLPAESESEQPLENAFVSAQTVDPNALDIKDQTIISSGTLTVENGEYALFLEPGVYNLVARKADYGPVCKVANLSTQSVSTVNFSLPGLDEEPGTVSGLVTIIDAAVDQFATLDFRQILACEGALDDAVITILSINIADGGTYELDLPAGEYQLVASTYDKDTVTIDLTVGSGEVTDWDITFD